jgi:hypothetical protein
MTTYGTRAAFENNLNADSKTNEMQVFEGGKNKKENCGELEASMSIVIND